MLSDRISMLFSLLQCNNTDIARYAGCSSGNISKLKTGNRIPKPSSRSILLLAEGVYAYADYENMLPTLSDLCNAKDTDHDTIVPALIKWLYEADDLSLPSSHVTPKSKTQKIKMRKAFGSKLDQAMNLLEISNRRLAEMLNVDVSLVSRYRSGIYSPHGNKRLTEMLSFVLFSQAEKTGKLPDLADLCKISEKSLDIEAIGEWLYKLEQNETTAAIAQEILWTMDKFPTQAIFPPMQQIESKDPESSCYFGTEGLQHAVKRFLSDAAKEGGELLLFSDEPMEWMTKDPVFFSQWASLMKACIDKGVKIRIIHNVDRGGSEMIDAFRGWLPLYVSGMIRPYVFNKAKGSRFYHTIFLRPRHACIRAFFPVSDPDSRWYDYITDDKKLSIAEHEFQTMLSSAFEFLKVSNISNIKDFCSFWADISEMRTFLLNDFPFFTMDESLFETIVSKSNPGDQINGSLLSMYKRLRKQFKDLLREGPVNMIVCWDGRSNKGKKMINYGLDVPDVLIEYTHEEYKEHIAQIIELIKKEKNFHLTLLPEFSFKGIQIAVSEDSVSVLRSKAPFAVFVFPNSNIKNSVNEYLSLLSDGHTADRNSTINTLENISQNYLDQ